MEHFELLEFAEFEKTSKKEKRGGVVMTRVEQGYSSNIKTSQTDTI